MNDEFSISDEQLQLATSRRRPPSSALDGELAAVQATFLALGESLERAGGDIDEQAVLAGVQRRLNVEGAHAPACMPVAAVKTQGLTPVGWIAIALSVAAAVLIALSILPRGGESIEVVQHPVVKTAAQIAGEPLDERERLPTPFAWDDPLDDEIALAAATLDQWSTSSRGVDASLTNMSNELSALSEELLSESL
jgi:hypothetical protein